MRRLREDYPEELVIIGVHSAKFPAEKLTANIRDAVMRHHIHHPVVNDADFAIWREYAVRAWPTIVLVDTQGRIAETQAGEVDAEAMAAHIEREIAKADADGSLDRTPVDGLDGAFEGDVETVGGDTDRLLAFPSKLLADRDGRLFVADTGNHRVLELKRAEHDRTAELIRVFGSGEPGLVDGPLEAAGFDDPHGLALSADGSTLYVADTGNHAIRAIDLADATVRTIAGTGKKGGYGKAPGEPLETDLRSPWAIVALDRTLLIAMAGSHQIWLVVEESSIGIFAGNGAEALVDGPRDRASFNQPSDLAMLMGHLVVADSEASAIRAITLSEGFEVSTLVGQGLFDFGDIDGAGGDVRLQHPTGIAAGDDDIFIADTYNNKLKRLNPTKGLVETFAGSGAAGTLDGALRVAEFNGPEGMSLLGARLFVADTNNHVVRVVDFEAEKVWTLEIE